MRTFKIVLFVLIGLVLLAVAVVAALIFVDPSIYRNQIETRASAAFGREFKIAGPIRLERSLRPRITVEDVSIGNPSWASGTHFAAADKLSLQVALLPLLRGKLNALDVVFSGVNLYIEEGPDNANNYTFGEGGDRETRGLLPPIERMHVNNSVINYKTADGRSKRFEVNEAQLWNIPGEPERVEARGSAQEMKFTILLTTDSAAELSGPQNPWSVELDIEGPNMALNLAGQMEQAFKWEQGDYRIKLWGKEADTLEKLFGVDFPTSGPFELSASLNKNPESFRVTDIAALLQGPPQTPAIKVSNGEASGGQDEPVELALQGQFDKIPFTLRFASTQPFEGLSQKTPWPTETQLKLADLKLNIAGEMIPATATERLEFNAQLQGESLATLAQLLDTELPEAGPYQFSFHTQIAEGTIRVTELKGSIEQAGPWQTLGVEQGQVSVKKTGSVAASLNAMLDQAPLSLTFEGGPKAPGGTWPLKLEAAATGATIKGEGAVVTTENGKVLQIATHISGNNFESLGPLIGTSLPAIGKFDLRADVSTDYEVHAADNLQVQIKNNRFSGSARWEDKAPRPVLSGKLAAKRLTPSDFKTPLKTTSKNRGAGLLDRPIKLDALNAFDARLELKVKSVAESPMPLADISSTVTLTNGKMSAPFRANLAGTPMTGQIQMRQRKNIPAVSLNVTAEKIDVGQTLKQLKIPETVSGTADTVELKASSTGKTLRALLAQPAFTLQLKPANLRYSIDIGDREFDFQIESAELAADIDQPPTGVFKGMLQGTPFNAEASTAHLKQIRKTDTPLPLRLTLQTENLQFQAEGAIFRPFENNAFELTYELEGAEIRGLDPLADYVMPLRGQFRARGRVTARGNRFTYEEDLRVGQSDLKANAVILRESPRPKISGSIISTQIHMDDVQLIDVDKEDEAAPTRDKSRLIPDYTLPIDEFFAVDADVDIKAGRIRTQLGDLGEFNTKISLKDGRLNYSLSIAGYTGGQLTGEFDLDAAADPPLTQVQLNAADINFGFLLSSFGVTDYLEGNVDLFVDLSGSGNTRYSMLGNVEGRITIIGGPGRISGRRIDLWAADLIPTMLSSQWQRENVTETNCLVAHIELGEGRAEIEDLLLDTQRITVAASGILNLETEELDVVMAPRPKRASLVSLANPVRIQGILAEPEVSVTRIPRRGRLAGAGLLAGLVNPAFLIFALSDTGTGDANPCEAVVEQAREGLGLDSQ